MNKVILLKNRPVGKPTLRDFEFIEEENPALQEGQVLLKTLYVSVDPYLRGRMSSAKSYVPPFELHKPVQSAIVAEVIESKLPDFKVGDYVTGLLDWKEANVSDGRGLTKDDGSTVS